MAKKEKRDELVFLEDILESIEKIEKYVENLTEKEFEGKSEKQDSVKRSRIFQRKQGKNIQRFNGGK